jgi:hypothetical protein
LLHPDDEICPLAECNNQPDVDDETRSRREQKRPDFQWVFMDNYEPDPSRSSKQFVVECKRLGRSTRSDWIINSNYVVHGICRFRNATHAYAQRFASGAMVGYWQNMDKDEVLADVNSAAQKESLPELVLRGDLTHIHVTQFEHKFRRPFEISPFHLYHLWIDLRACS